MTTKMIRGNPHTTLTLRLHTQFPKPRRLLHLKYLYHPLQDHSHRYRRPTFFPRSRPPQCLLLSRFRPSVRCLAMLGRRPQTRHPVWTTSGFYGVP